MLNIIEKAKEGAARSSAFGAIDAAKLLYIENMAINKTVTTGSAASLQLAGSKATSGTWSVNLSTGEIRVDGIQFENSDYVCTGSAADMKCTR